MSFHYEGVYRDGDALCEFCMGENEEEDYPINRLMCPETDAPEHCSACGRPLYCSLTAYGVQYVIDSAKETLREGRAEYTKPGCNEPNWFYADMPRASVVVEWLNDLVSNCGMRGGLAERMMDHLIYQCKKAGWKYV